ncbi:unnamed protein product [Schistosoma mattheei]|uniref:Histone-lysine N-methyltransferase n=1 Tax=Schistosoma mattheei TaxID=31246 RepID=A0AA85BU35_9TREM|nr:unnamed protein product [Schistosoma mattheei]
MPSISDDYQVGNIFWAKVGSHPWWPCMVYHSPDGDSYVKEKGRSFIYHVQFLGPLVERAWVSANNLIPFSGKKNFDEYVQEKLRTTKDKSEKIKFESKSVSSNKSIWIQSWKEAEVAMNLTVNERIERFGRISVKQKSRRLDKAEEGELLELMSNVPLTIEEEAESLSTFLKDELEIRMQKNPELDKKMLEDELRSQWPALDIAEKRKYLRDQLGIFDDPLQRLEKSRKCKETTKVNESGTKSTDRTPKSSKKSGSKKQQPETQEFDIEIHRLIVSPAQYRLQPVCPVCEVYSNAPGQMFQCQGPCGRIVHPHCMRYKTPPPADNSRPEKFRCPQCLIGEFLCSICGKPSETGSKDGAGQLYACQVINCSRHFHRDCLSGWPGILTRPSDNVATRTATFQILRCPAHTCNTCYLESNETNCHPVKRPTSSEGPFLECVRCPAVFHTGDLCTPAGSVEVSLSHIVCPRHFDESLLTLSNFKTQHPNWCFHCLKHAPERIECQLCPTTYHKDCFEPSLGILTDDKFICRSCRRGVFPRYAQIIWAKIPGFRWWPCEIIHARNAPINILNMAHPEGSFPVHFLGSEEYQWISRNRVFPYEIGLQTSSAKDTSGSNKIEKAFSRSLHRAPKAHALYVNHVLKQGLPLISMHAEQLPENELLSLNALNVNTIIDPNMQDHQLSSVLESFSFIEANIYTDEYLIDNIKKSYESLTVCSCKSSTVINSETITGSNLCSTNNSCHHFLSRVECKPQICSFLETDCGNRRFSLLLNAAYTTNTTTTKQDDKHLFNVVRTINRGYGLKTLTSFQQGDLVIEYSGEVIDIAEANRRIIEALGPNALSSITSSRKGFHPLSETYLARFSSQLNLVLDSGTKGNLSRFINHSCEPNLIAECWTVDGYPRLGLFACRPIEANEELTINYIDAQFLSTGLMAAICLCLCGADSCISTLRLPTSFKLYEEEVVNDTIPNPHIIEKRKSKKLDESTLPLEALTINNRCKSKSPPPVKICEVVTPSVTSLLAAAVSQLTTNQQRDRVPLISPVTMAARAASSSVSLHKNHTIQTKVEGNAESNTIGFNPAIHEDFCYRCGDGGELILCDKSTCSKAYHLNCLGLSVPPLGIWYCPWHYCDLCGHPSNHLCWRCPNSYCEEHANHNCIQVDSLDIDRWKLAKSSLNDVTNPSIVFSVRWICSDHVGLKIYGPDYRPVLYSDSNIPTKKVAVSKNLDKLSTEVKQNGGESNLVNCFINEEREVENIIPKTPNVSDSKITLLNDGNIASTLVTTTTSTTVINSNGDSNQKLEPRRLEPLKVTLKRKLKAELAAKENNSVSGPNDENNLPSNLVDTTPNNTNNSSSVTTTLSGNNHPGNRKRLLITSPLTDKKRTRLSRDNTSK